jgi:hypothetical protein
MRELVLGTFLRWKKEEKIVIIMSREKSIILSSFYTPSD